MSVMLVFLVWAVGIQSANMVFCLAEAVREQLPQHLQSTRLLTFHSDANKNRLLLLCQVCGADLQPRHGLLGTQLLGDDNSAAGLAIAILLQIMKSLCTLLSGAP